MALSDILTSYQLSPEAEARFSKSVIQNIHGSVRTNLGSLLMPAVLFAILGMLELTLFRMGGLLGMFSLIIYLLGTILFFWEMLSFQLDFDGSTGFVQYHTLLHGTTTYHIDELMMFDVTQQRMQYNRSRMYFRRHGYAAFPSLLGFSDAFRARGTLRVRELLTITTASGIIVIPLAASWFSSKLVHGVGGFRDSEKFYTYLDLYRRYMLKNEPLSDQVAEDVSLSPAVRAAIAAQLAQQEQDAPHLPESIPELTADDYDPVSTPKVKAPQTPLSTPDLSVPVTGIPETHVLPQKFDTAQPEMAPPASAPAEPSQPEPASAFPDPAQKPDVDALFNSVLQRYGKR